MLFIIFLKIDIQSKIINYLSTFTFAIYIIHSDLSIRTYLYTKIFRTEMYWNSPDMIINFIKTIIGIYFGCLIVEFIRRLIILPIKNKIKIKNLEISVE